MRSFLLCGLIVSLATLCSLAEFCAARALAHGGSYRGPYTPIAAPSIPCDCASADCARCSAPGLPTSEGLSRSDTRFQVLRTWGDLAHVRITTTFETQQKDAFLEGYARVAPAPLLALTTGGIETGKERLSAELRPDRDARRSYLYRRWTSLLDPLLVRRRGPGSVELRAFPITPGKRTTVTLEGFVLLAAPGRAGVRAYRTGDLCLVMQPVTEASRKTAVYLDVEGDRALSVLDARTCKRRHPHAFARAIAVPCVPALEAVLRGDGSGAVSAATALVALPPGPALPRDLFIGKASDAPRRTPTGPTGPASPPPPPPQAPGPPTPVAAPPPPPADG